MRAGKSYEILNPVTGDVKIVTILNESGARNRMLTRRPLEDRLRMSGNEDALDAIAAARRQGALEALDRAIDAADKHELGGVPAWLFNLRAEIEGGK